MARKKKKNDFSFVNLKEIDKPKFTKYQNKLLEIPYDQDVMVLKSRQIGFTYVAAWLSLWLAISQGRNQVHISASLNQVSVMRRYIFIFAQTYFDVEMHGRQCATCLLPESVESELPTVDFIFCSTNSTTAQSYNGDLWVDEFAWIPKAEQVMDTAIGMTSNKKYRMVYITTPSTTSAYAFQIWKGVDEYGNPKKDFLHRLQINIDEAIADGCDWIDREKILARAGERRFLFMYMCQWVDDACSLFKLWQIQKCFIKNEEGDLLEKYEGSVKVPTVCGVDPNGEGGDTFAIVICELGENLTVLETQSLQGYTIDQAMATLEKMMKRHSCKKIVYDVTGVGQGMRHRLNQWRDIAIHEIYYDYDVKQRLVFHLESLVADQKIRIPHTDQALIQSFLLIQNATTTSGKASFRSKRKQGLGHADLFWALAHAASQFEQNTGILHFKKKNRGKLSFVDLSGEV